MTAIRARRRKATVAAFVAAVVGVGAVGGLGYAGVDTLYDSRAGRRVAPTRPDTTVQALPDTPTALVATSDDEGWLTSIAVLALAPGGAGGSIASLSPSGDAASGNIDALAPLNAVYVVDGPAELLGASEGLTGMSFDVAEVVDAERFAELTRPLGELTVELPTELRDASTGLRLEAGVVRLAPGDAAAAIVARDPAIADWLLDPARAAVWGGVADRVGDGIGSVPDPSTAPRTLDEFVARLFAGPVQHRSFSTREIDPERVTAQLADTYVDAFSSHDDTAISVVTHDRAELLMVLAAIAPSRMGAPFEGPTVRVLSRFAADELAPLGQNNADVARQAINRLLFAKVNVVSFGQVEAAPELTLIEVPDERGVEAAEATYGTLFGESDVRVADSLIAGIDLQITLGRAYLETVEPNT